MKLRQLVTGVASGYLTKAVQFIAAIVLVPFLLRSKVLGLGGYGNVFTILALTSFLPLVVSGVRISFTRSVAQAIDSSDRQGGPGPGEVIGSGFKILAVACAFLATLTLLLARTLLPLIGLPLNRDTVWALTLALSLFWVENSLIIFSIPALTRGAISFVNCCGTVEVIARTATYFVVFSLAPATLALYFGIQASFALLRSLAIAGHLRWNWPNDLIGFRKAPWRQSKASLMYSLPVTALLSSDQLVGRVPVLLASKFLGADVSGLLAIVTNTLRRYVMQTLFAVLQPIAVPLATRLDPRRMIASARETLWHVEELYASAAVLVISLALALMPRLVRLWLGPSYEVISVPAQVLLLAYSIEIALNLRRSILIGQGLLGAAIPRVLTSAAVGFGGIVAAALIWKSWQLMVGAAAGYFVLANAWGIGQAFSQSVLLSVESGRPRSRIVAFALVAGCSAIALSRWTSGGSPATLVFCIVADVVLVAVFSHALLIRLSVAMRTLKKLRTSMQHDLFRMREHQRPASA